VWLALTVSDSIIGCPPFHTKEIERTMSEKKKISPDLLA
jgi:hypothetical protein